jgi:hypothetical protein
MTEFDSRRGVIAGTIVSLVMAATSSGWSNDQPRAAIETFAVGFLLTLLAVVVVRSRSQLGGGPSN